MIKSPAKPKRSIATTAIATLIGIVILFFSLLLLPISGFSELLTFGVGILLFILCAVVAIDGKKGTMGELIYSLVFWR